MSPWDFAEDCSKRFDTFAILKVFIELLRKLWSTSGLEGDVEITVNPVVAVHDKYHCKGSSQYFMCLFGSCCKLSWTVEVKISIKTLYDCIHLQ